MSDPVIYADKGESDLMQVLSRLAERWEYRNTMPPLKNYHVEIVFTKEDLGIGQ